MKKILLGGIALILLTLLLFIASKIFLNLKPESDIKPTEKMAYNTDKTSVKPDISQLAKNSKNAVPVNAIHINATDDKKLTQSLNTVNSSVEYMSVMKSELPPSEIDNLRQDFDNLSKYGSYSGGKITHEFANANEFKAALQKTSCFARYVPLASFWCEWQYLPP